MDDIKTSLVMHITEPKSFVVDAFEELKFKGSKFSW